MLQRTENKKFNTSLEFLNSFMEKEKDVDELPSGGLVKLVANLRNIGLYDMALDYFALLTPRDLPEELLQKAGDDLQKMKVDKNAILKANFRKNIAALKKSFPDLHQMMRGRASENMLVAGDHETGYRILKKVGRKYEDITFTESRIEEVTQRLEDLLPRMQNENSASLSDFLICDVIIRLAELTKRNEYKSQLVLYVVEKEKDIFHTILQTHDIADLMTIKRLVPFVGDYFENQIAEWFGANLFAPYPTLHFLSREVAERVGKCVGKALDAYRDKLVRNKSEISKYYEGISNEEWRAKFQSGKLKILLETTRYSSYIKHCTKYAANALGKLGHSVEIHIEPDDASPGSLLAILDHVISFKPDFAFTIDYDRGEPPDAYPPQLPFATWMQDEFGTIYDGSVKSGPRDFIFTVLKDDFVKSGYNPDEIHVLPIVASEEIFHPMELTDKDMETYGCDVAFVSNIPSWNDLLKSSKRPDDKLLYAYIRNKLEQDINACVTGKDYEAAIADAGKLIGVSIETKKLEEYAMFVKIHGVGSLLARTLPMEWIAAAGFDLHLYGNHWDEVPHLEKFARGPVENGAPLCKAFRAAKINISTSTGVTMHPRVFECMLSGGFALVRHMPREKDKLSIYDFFDAGVEFDVFASREDLIEKISYYLKNEDKRREAAERGRRKTLEKYTYLKQMEYMIETVRKNFLSHLDREERGGTGNKTI